MLIDNFSISTAVRVTLGCFKGKNVLLLLTLVYFTCFCVYNFILAKILINFHKMECESKEIASEEVTNGSELKENEEVKKVNEETEEAGEAYAYLERNEFTSEIYKIEVKNLGYFGIGVSIEVLQNNYHFNNSSLLSGIQETAKEHPQTGHDQNKVPKS